MNVSFFCFFFLRIVADIARIVVESVTEWEEVSSWSCSWVNTDTIWIQKTD